MKNSLTLALASGLAATAAAAETVHAVLVFSRHGDRTTKHFGNQVLTPLGANQARQVGSDYRARYLAADSPHRIKDISEFQYVPAQIYATAPDQGILLDTATSFLLGLYPPLGDIKPDAATSKLANGSSVTGPLNGYQYVQVHGVDTDSPDTIWIKGDYQCPAQSIAANWWRYTSEYQYTNSLTRDFYRSLYPLVSDFYPSADDLSYDKAYDIFDVINVARIHNASSPASNVTDAQLLQLRTLADSAEFGFNWDISTVHHARAIHARTLAGAIISHLQTTVDSAARTPKFTYLSGSYDTFLSWFGLSQLTDVSDDFYGLPEYASTMAFELFTAGNDKVNFGTLRVRFLFRNGTDGELKPFPLFGRREPEMMFTEFDLAMRDRALLTAKDWCTACDSAAEFCKAYKLEDKVGNGFFVLASDYVHKRALIGVLVVMCVAIVGNIAWAALWLLRARQEKAKRQFAAVTAMTKDTGSMSSIGRESV